MHKIVLLAITVLLFTCRGYSQTFQFYPESKSQRLNSSYLKTASVGAYNDTMPETLEDKFSDFISNRIPNLY